MGDLTVKGKQNKAVAMAVVATRLFVYYWGRGWKSSKEKKRGSTFTLAWRSFVCMFVCFI